MARDVVCSGPGGRRSGPRRGAALVRGACGRRVDHRLGSVDRAVLDAAGGDPQRPRVRGVVRGQLRRARRVRVGIGRLRHAPGGGRDRAPAHARRGPNPGGPLRDPLASSTASPTPSAHTWQSGPPPSWWQVVVPLSSGEPRTSSRDCARSAEASSGQPVRTSTQMSTSPMGTTQGSGCTGMNTTSLRCSWPAPDVGWFATISPTPLCVSG